MKCPKCGTEMEWMGDVTILIKDTDKYYHKLTKKAFLNKNIEIWGVDWDMGSLFCPNYLKCGNHPIIRARETESEDKDICEKCLYTEETDGSHCYECVKGKSKFKEKVKSRNVYSV